MKSCKTFRHWMQESMEGDLPPQEEAALQAHLDRCPVCREEYASLRASIAFLEEMPPAPLPVDFVSLVAERIARESPHILARRHWLFREGGLQPASLFALWIAFGLTLIWGIGFITGQPPDQIISPQKLLQTMQQLGDTGTALLADGQQQGRMAWDAIDRYLPGAMLPKVLPFLIAAALLDVVLIAGAIALWRRRRLSSFT